MPPRQRLPIMLQTFSFLFPLKIKSAATEVTAQKTQTPIVAKLTDVKMSVPHTFIPWEFAFLSNSSRKSVCRNKRIIPKRKYTHFHIYSVSLAHLSYHSCQIFAIVCIKKAATFCSCFFIIPRVLFGWTSHINGDSFRGE